MVRVNTTKDDNQNSLKDIYVNLLNKVHNFASEGNCLWFVSVIEITEYKKISITKHRWQTLNLLYDLS